MSVESFIYVYFGFTLGFITKLTCRVDLRKFELTYHPGCDIGVNMTRLNWVTYAFLRMDNNILPIVPPYELNYTSTFHFYFSWMQSLDLKHFKVGFVKHFSPIRLIFAKIYDSVVVIFYGRR